MIIAKANMSVARVVQYGSSDIGKSERHNERKNGSYENLNVDPERISMNVHFINPGEETYMEILKRKEKNGEISTRGLRQDATLFDEMIIDVNTMYFEERGGYEYAEEFYAEATRFAEKKYGSENVISAVMHADEINQAATEECGHPVYHYHLHVIAMPVVEKEVRWSKRCKDPELVGKVKEVIHQISHSKKWESKTPELDDGGNPVMRSNGKPKFIKSYSLLQDELFEHMKEAGFKDFERGERGSTAQHLSSLQFQYEKDKERLAELGKKIDVERIEYETVHKAFLTYNEIDSLGKKKAFGGKVVVSEKDFSDLKDLAKEGIEGRSRIIDLSNEVNSLRRRVSSLAQSCYNLEDRLDELEKKCRPYLDALKRFPEKVNEFIQGLLRIPERPKEKEHDAPTVKHKRRDRDDWSR